MNILSALKYLSIFIVFIALGFSYLFLTDSGKAHVYQFLSQTFSQKTDLDITVYDIDMHNFPKVIALMNVDHKANLIVDGKVGLNTLDIDYTFTSDQITYDGEIINDSFQIDGHVSGHYNNMYVVGKGSALGGKISYQTTKRTDRIEKLLVTMKGINSKQLFERMGQEALMDGKADVHIDFDYMDTSKREGFFTYDVKDKNYSGIPLFMHAKVNIKNNKHTFKIDMKAPSLLLSVKDGTYDLEKKLAKASYTLDIDELGDLKTLLGYKYKGAFHSTGEMIYENRLSITGYSHTYGGVLDYHFERDGLTIGLHDVSFKSFMNIFPYEHILNADATGNIYYNFIKKTIIINTQLKNAKLLKSKFTKNIYKKSHVRMTKETFETSHLDAAYHNGIFTTDIRLGNHKNHAYLTNAIIDTRKNSIRTYFDFKLQKKAFTGKVYGDYSDPKVNLDTKEALEYQLTHKFDSVIGKKNRENIEKFVNTIPLGNSVKDIASEVAASFLDIMF